MASKYIFWCVIFLLSVIPDESRQNELIYGTISGTDGKCNCHFNVPSVAVCTEYDTHYMSLLASLDNRVGNLTSHLHVFIYQWLGWEEKYDTLDRNISSLGISCVRQEDQNNKGQNSDRERVNEIRRHLLNSEETLSTIKDEKPDDDLLYGLEKEAENITRAIIDLAMTVVGMEETERQRRVSRLESELRECKERPSDIQQRLTQRQWPKKGLQDSCKRLSLILRPFTVRSKTKDARNSPKVWFSDPLNNTSTIWLGVVDRTVRIVQYGSRTTAVRSTLQQFNHSHGFETAGDEDLTIYLPHQIEKIPIVAYNNYMYYIEYNTRNLIKHDITQNMTVSSTTLPSDIGTGNTYDYTISNERSSIDLEVDETGVWIIYSNPYNNGLVVLSKINVTTLEFEDTWFGNYPKKAIGDCFVACGTLYCINSYELSNVKVNYFYDTKTGEEGFTDVPFDSKYNEIKSVKYNSYDQKLYVTDSGNAVVYDMVFG